MQQISKPCRLTSLPAELREQIWILALDVDSHCTNYYPLEPGLTAVSRGIRAETIPLYYSRLRLGIYGDIWCERNGKLVFTRHAYRNDRIEPVKLNFVTRLEVRCCTLSADSNARYFVLNIALDKRSGIMSITDYSAHAYRYRSLNASETADPAYIEDVMTILRSHLSARTSSLMSCHDRAPDNMQAAVLDWLASIGEGVLQLRRST
ncbi:hypothetical protein LTR09_008983 [Extremus antarcticus]|uniref:Uncharacterized protein n=1 Tax=Extremus antarcticus TaxID=702011 RepID=A0AAJ0D9V2_9PEZI|nr:hypothetical protein LTR09_008983 [Extremus antarcticus]